jgi:SAM-dependent methyltransferase
MVLSLLQQNLSLPERDVYGRIATLNGYGASDPASNEIIEDFIQWAKAKAPHASDPGKVAVQSYVLEVGGAFGFVARRVLDNGSYLLFNDLSEDHIQIAEQGFPENLQPSQYEVFPGEFPAFPKEPGLFKELQEKRIVGIGAFMVAHFMSGEKFEEFLDKIHRLLVPGGRVFITAATIYNRLFEREIPSYENRKRDFFDKGKSKSSLPSLKENPRKYPGELRAHDFLPEGQYKPVDFHVFDKEVLAHIAQNRPGFFRVIKSVYIMRPNPPNQSYPKGYESGRGEIVGIVLEKP